MGSANRSSRARGSDDRELLAAVDGGDLEAFDELMRRYERLVFRVAYGYCFDRETALDLTQTVFLKAYRALPRFRGDRLKPWLLRITANEAISWQRRESRIRAAEVPAEPDEHQGDDDPGRAARRSQERRWLNGALGRLGERYRTAILLRYVHGMRGREMAEALDCSEAMVKNLLFRGVRMLREHAALTGAPE